MAIVIPGVNISPLMALVLPEVNHMRKGMPKLLTLTLAEIWLGHDPAATMPTITSIILGNTGVSPAAWAAATFSGSRRK